MLRLTHIQLIEVKGERKRTSKYVIGEQVEYRQDKFIQDKNGLAQSV